MANIWDSITSVFTRPVQIVRDSIGAAIGILVTLVDALVKVLLPLVQRISDVVLAVSVFLMSALHFVYQFFHSLPGWLASQGAALSAIYTAATASVIGVFPAPMQQALAFLNYFVPLSEVLIFLALLGTLLFVTQGLRAVKGWIPWLYGA